VVRSFVNLRFFGGKQCYVVCFLYCDVVNPGSLFGRQRIGHCVGPNPITPFYLRALIVIINEMIITMYS